MIHKIKTIGAAFVLSTATLLQAQDAMVEKVVADTVNTVVSALKTNGLSIEPEAASRAALEAVIHMTDPGSRFVSKKDIKHITQEQKGLDYQYGLRITRTNGWPSIIDIVSNAPAAIAGLKSGDILLSINETNFTNKTIAEASSMLRGHGATTNHLRYVRNGATNEIDIALQLIQLPTIETQEEWPFQLAYIKINGLYSESGKEIRSVLRKWAETGEFGVILDLRGGNGDDIAAVSDIGSLFVESGSLLWSFRNADDQDLDVFKASASDAIHMPIMALIDEQTQGASEILAAVLKGSVRGAMLIGTTTRGDPLIRTPVQLPNGDTVYLANIKLVTADGAVCTGKEGIEPDLAVKIDPAYAEYEPEPLGTGKFVLEEAIQDRALRTHTHGDPTLRRAVDVLLGLKALNLHGIPDAAETEP